MELVRWEARGLLAVPDRILDRRLVANEIRYVRSSIENQCLSSKVIRSLVLTLYKGYSLMASKMELRGPREHANWDDYDCYLQMKSSKWCRCAFKLS